MPSAKLILASPSVGLLLNVWVGHSMGSAGGLLLAWGHLPVDWAIRVQAGRRSPLCWILSSVLPGTCVRPLRQRLSSMEPPADGRPGRRNHRRNSTIINRPGTLPSASYYRGVQCGTHIASSGIYWDHRRPGPIHGRRNLCANLNLHHTSRPCMPPGHL